MVGASRYRNPDEDLPADFETRRGAHYDALNLPLDPDRFIAGLRVDTTAALRALDAGLPHDPLVRISRKAGGWITVAPLERQPEPTNLAALKAAIGQTWPMIRLLDVLKETDLRLDFTGTLKSPTAHEALDRTVLRPRLLLCLHGLGTNAGLKRMVGLDDATTYKDLLYARQRFITVEGLRRAIAIVANGTLKARNPLIWGEGTTACASDAKHFGAPPGPQRRPWSPWERIDRSAIDGSEPDQPMARPLRRPRHHDLLARRAEVVVHPLPAQVAVLVGGGVDDRGRDPPLHRDGGRPAVRRQPSIAARDRSNPAGTAVSRPRRGQSEVAFAFCRLLGFQLLPRLRRIHKQRLYRPEAGRRDDYPNLQPVLARPIDWDLIRRQYDEMVKYATALRLGTAETEAILRRFTRSNVQHPTYKALAELGKAAKTLFLCRYLHGLPLRHEIHEGLNVIEQWNSANDFVFFARKGELASNRREDHEISMLALHLLQNAMVYINTLMIQQTLALPAWANRLTGTDHRALTPLIWEHINPYGRFDLDMAARLALA